MPRPKSIGSKRTFPVAGDLVQVAKTDDSLIRVGSYGVINGEVGKRRSTLDVTFNFTTPYYDGKIVSASGGPVRGIRASRLKPIGRKQLTFWRFKYDIPTAGGGVNFTRTVNVFEVDLNRSW